MGNRQASSTETEAVDAGPGTGPVPAGVYPFENATMANAIDADGSGAVPAQLVAALAADGGIQAATRLVERTPQGGGTPAELVDSHTSWGALAEDRLGAELLAWAVRGDHRTVEAALDMLGTTDRDDVAVAMARTATDAQLAALSGSSGGQALLSRMFDELTSGSVGADEQEQADRILRLKAQGTDPKRAAEEMLSGLVFPFKLPGLTVFHDAPIIAERRPEGMVWVQQPVRVLAADKFREETGTLPTPLFSSGILLPEGQIVGVKLYDVDEKVVYRPALFLIQLANEGSAATAGTLAEIVGIALTFGTGALAGVGAEATLAARVLVWSDRAATALAMITLVLDEHRGMIVSRFGEAGARFVQYVDLVASATAMYGFGRVVVEMAHLVQALRAAYRSWRSAVRAAGKDLSDGDGQAVQQISEETENLFGTADEIGASTPAGPSAAPGTAPTPAGPAAALAPTPAGPAAAPAAQVPASPGGAAAPAPRTVAPEDDYDFTAADHLRDPVRDAHHVALRQMALDSMDASGPNQPVKVVPASYTPMTEAKGYITTAKFVLGRTPEQIAEILGQRALANGVTVYALDRSAITLDNLNTRGLTQSPDGKHPSRSTPANLQRYPVGKGAPQWSLSDNVPAVEVGRAMPGDRLTFSPTKSP